mgnify:CR=1 FL=1
MKEKINNSNQELLNQEDKIILEKLEKLDNKYKKFKKIMFIITFLTSVFAYLMGHKVGSKLTSDNKYKIDNEYNMFDTSFFKLENNNFKIKQETTKLLNECLKHNYGVTITEEELIEFAKVIIKEKYNINLSYDEHINTKSKALVKKQSKFIKV